MEKNWIKDGKFIELKTEQKTELSEKQVLSYYADLTENRLKSIETANDEQTKALTDELDKMNATIKGMKIDELEANYNGLNEVVKSIKVSNTIEEGVVLSMTKQILTQIQKGDLKSLKKGETLDIIVKTTVETDAIADNTFAQRLPGIGQLPNPRPVMTDVLTSIPTSTGVIVYMDTDSVTRAANTTAENGAYPESAISWVEKTMQIHKITDIIPITDELIQDYPALVEETKRFITDNIFRKINSQLLIGNNIGENLNGLFTQAPAFNDATYAGVTFSDANLLDLFDVLETEIQNGSGGKYVADTVFMSNNDYLALSNKKDANGNYIFKNMLSNIHYNIIRSSLVPNDTLVLGDSKFATIRMRKDIKIAIGNNGDDFGHGRQSIRGDARLNLLIKGSDLGAFLKVTSISEAITAITTP